MNKFPKFLLAVVLLAAVMCAAFFMAGGPEKKALPAPVAKSTTFVKPANVAPAAAPQVTPTVATEANSPAVMAEDPDQPNAQIIATIDDAAVLYSPEGLPKIQPYLLHSDPEVRAAAIDGMINLGEAGGAALLRAAANLAPSAEEAAAMREAAAFLDLPPGRLPKRVAPSN